MSRKGTGMSGSDPYVKQVQVRPCGSSHGAGTRVNIAGYEFELIDTARHPVRETLPPPVADPSSPVVEDTPSPAVAEGRSPSRESDAVEDRALVRQSIRREAIPSYEAPGRGEDEIEAVQGGGMDLATVHRLLKGRYVWAIALSILLAGAGVFAGIHFGHETFQSSGIVAVVPVTYIYDTPEKRNTSNQELVRACAAKFVSQSVILQAMDSADWRNNHSSRTNETEAEFTKNLQVTQEGQLLVVKFTDGNRDDAQAAVRATMAAFETQFYSDQNARSASAKAALETQQNQLTLQLTDARERIAKIAGEFGPEGLKAEREYLNGVVHHIETELNDLAAGNGAVAVDSTLTDRIVQRLEDFCFEEKNRLAQMEATGVGTNMKQRTEVANLLKYYEDELDKRKKELASVSSQSGVSVELSPAQVLAARKTRLEDQKTDIINRMKMISSRIADIDKLQIVEERTQRDLDTVSESLHQRTVETKIFQLDITKADHPLTPYRDTRIAFSAGGGAGGLLLGFGFVALLGFLDRRVLDPSDTMERGRRYPVLGVLPQLPEDLADPEQSAFAAHGVHEIRNRLQMAGADGSLQQVFSVTGAVAGSGKTSLTLGLGVSFAAAGFKTLVIDVDLVGGGLSTRINAIVRRKIGQVLLREGLITSQQLEEALSQGRTAGCRVGEMLVQLGYLDEADLLAVVERQSLYTMGVLEAMSGDDLNDCVIATGINNLWALPLGSATASDAGSISGVAMRRLCSRAREMFDIVIMDSGPIPGSIEATLAASNADAVVLVVARGDTRPAVQRTMSYLQELSVRFAGMVFNRARKRDVERYGSSHVSSPKSTTPQKVERVDSPETVRFGPLPRSVVSRSSRPADAFRAN